MNITLAEKKVSSRLKSSSMLLQKMNKNIYCVRDKTDFRNFIVIGASNAAPGTNYFKIGKAAFFGNYQEVWITSKNNEFKLVKIYFSLFTYVNELSKYEELLAFHCDLDANPDLDKHRYKIHPHLHVSCAKFDYISKAHFSMCLTNHKDTISNIQKLDKIFSDFFDMINYEFIH